MKKVFAFVLIVGMAFVFAACGTSDTTLFQMGGTNTPSSAQQEPLSGADEPNIPADASEDDLETEISIFPTVGEYRFPATLLSSETAAAFTEHLPLTLNMSELNGNEKYFYLDNSLPTDSFQRDRFMQAT